MPDRKIIAVAGATGAQGGSLIRAILNDPSGGFAARALVRDVNSDKARELARQGVEVIPANVDDLESLKKAFRGAYGAYCVTFFWEHFSPEQEFAQARNLAQAAQHAGVKHAVWSTLEDTRRWVSLDDDRMPTLMGKYKVPHFDAKGQADGIFAELGVPTTYLLTSFYWENFIHFGAGPKPGSDGTLVLAMPMGDRKLPAIAVADIGRCAYAVFQRGREFIGKRVGIAGEHLTGAEMAAALGRALGRPVRYYDIAPEAYRSLGFPGAEDMGNMFQFKRDFNDVFCGARDIAFARKLNPSLQSFEQWLAENGSRIPIE